MPLDRSILVGFLLGLVLGPALGCSRDASDDPGDKGNNLDVPPPDLVTCGDLTVEGECDGDVLHYCDVGDRPTTVNCKALGSDAVCFWVNDDDGYVCGMRRDSGASCFVHGVFRLCAPDGGCAIYPSGDPVCEAIPPCDDSVVGTCIGDFAVFGCQAGQAIGAWCGAWQATCDRGKCVDIPRDAPCERGYLECAEGLSCTVLVCTPLDVFECDLEADLVVSTEADLEAFSQVTCPDLRGDLLIDGTSLTNLDGLEQLRRVGGDVRIVNNPELTDISAIAQLRRVGGDVRVEANPSLESLAGLGALSEVGNNLRIHDNAVLAAAGLQSLVDVGASLIVSSNPALPNLAGLNWVANVGEDLVVMDNQTLESAELLSLTELDDRLVVIDNPVLPACRVLILAARLRADGWSGALTNTGNDEESACP